MRDQTKLRAFELADEVELLIYRATVGFPNPLSKRLGYFDGYDISGCESKIGLPASINAQKLMAFSLNNLNSYGCQK